jgi:hypothetical protein
VVGVAALDRHSWQFFSSEARPEMKEKIYAALGLFTMLVVGALVLECNKPWYCPATIISPHPATVIFPQYLAGE